jgi:hypothetical protein
MSALSDPISISTLNKCVLVGDANILEAPFGDSQ